MEDTEAAHTKATKKYCHKYPEESLPHFFLHFMLNDFIISISSNTLKKVYMALWGQ